MSTPRDLFFVTLDVPGTHPVEQGDLSLALAGAELVDLLSAGSVSLDGERILPGLVPGTDDRLLDEAGAALVREAPYETVEDWLWRRGRGLASAYVDAMEAAGQVAGRRHRWMPRGSDRPVPVDSPARRAAADRWAGREPVLAGLAAALGIPAEADDEAAEPDDEAALTVLAAVHDAVQELEAVRQRRRIEDAAFDNIWRAP
ncbi:GPP34 family phosphoprotein [Streptomyces sp. MK5]|uniref:GPP34 family phosphoprotein n=1 Tax=Streptomyces sp. MK5 TaxID=3064253 RepID=UPI0027429426|nr:GPP34 family phosphoprotein [Streptomyces sp. MK5]